MTNKKPPTPAPAVSTHDPYRMRGIEQILQLFDGGEFLSELMQGHKDLQLDLIEHKELHGTKGCQGSMTLTINYALGKSGDVAMGAKVDFKGPKKPASSAAAFINDDGELTLYSPFMARMHQPIKDVTEHDPETGEIIDIE